MYAAACDTEVVSTPEQRVLEILFEQNFTEYLRLSEVGPLLEVLLLAQNPVLRDRGNRLAAQWKQAFKIVRSIGGTGHTLEHHCLESFPLNKLDAQAIIEAFAGVKKKKLKAPGQVTARASNELKKVRLLCGETILRCRAIGVNIGTLEIEEKVQVGSSCAFKTRAIVDATAEWMTVRFLRIVARMREKKLNHVAVECTGGVIDIQYLGHLGGFTMFAPICAIGSDILNGVIGYESKYRLGEIIPTIEQLKPKKGKKSDYEQVLFFIVEAMTKPVVLNTGFIKAIFTIIDDGFGIFSMYPTPDME